MENIPAEFDCVTTSGAVRQFYPHLHCHLAAIDVDGKINTDEAKARTAVVAALVRTDRAEQELARAKLELHCLKMDFYCKANACIYTERESQLAILCAHTDLIRQSGTSTQRSQERSVQDVTRSCRAHGWEGKQGNTGSLSKRCRE